VPTEEPLAVWYFPPREPVEVVCHGDLAPYNCVFDGDRLVGVIDFDTAHPGPRLWDVAGGAYRLVPLVAPTPGADGPAAHPRAHLVEQACARPATTASTTPTSGTSPGTRPSSLPRRADRWLARCRLGGRAHCSANDSPALIQFI
jgi:hypothetical protein